MVPFSDAFINFSDTFKIRGPLFYLFRNLQICSNAVLKCVYSHFYMYICAMHI